MHQAFISLVGCAIPSFIEMLVLIGTNIMLHNFNRNLERNVQTCDIAAWFI